MVSRTARESKAQLTHIAAMRIIESEKTQRQQKTARLRKLRLAQDESDRKDTSSEASDVLQNWGQK